MVNRPTALTQSVEVSGQQLRVSIATGEPGVTPLLLMNGIGARLELLQPLVDRLQPRRTIVGFDAPGVGGSPTPLLPYRLTHLSRMVDDMLLAVGVDGPVDVLGISWGGALAQQFAFTCRSRVRRLVLVATAPGSLMVPARPHVLAKMITHRRYDDPEYMAMIAGDIYGGSARTRGAQIADSMRTHRSTADARGYLYQLGAGLAWSSLGILPLISAPTLILAGTDDPLIPVANARILHRMVRGSELTLYQGGHLGLVSEADELAPVIEEFLDR
ncbi:MAG: hypothetical protein QG671_1785 [Actinomycetota bacterium]|nr:hypothetical protein [Actinomycetota bacterium]